MQNNDFYLPEPIESFRDEYYFLSNFYPCDINYGGITYKSAEAAFQAQKCFTEEGKRVYTTYTPSQAKWHGRREKIPSLQWWESNKVRIMYDIVKAKFVQNPDLLNRLLATNGALLIEGNTWHDNYWGRCTCPRCQKRATKGQNMLGAILMRVRSEIKNGQ